jgi:hypothetical protein
LISIDRADMVTVAAKFPDTVAPLVAADTEAQIEVEGLAGATIAGRVTRFAPAIQSSDRTVRVEVDLFNGDAKAHARLVRRILGAELAPLGAAGVLPRLGLRVAGRSALVGLHKGADDTCPVCALPPAAAESPRRLLPGMTGTMKLLLRRFADAYVLPSTAVYTRGGKSYILVVRDGTTHQVPVRVQVNDGRTAEVAVVTRRKDGTGAAREVLAELTGDELVVDSRQLELGEGAAVQPAVGDW